MTTMESARSIPVPGRSGRAPGSTAGRVHTGGARLLLQLQLRQHRTERRKRRRSEP